MVGFLVLVCGLMKNPAIQILEAGVIEDFVTSGGKEKPA